MYDHPILTHILRRRGINTEQEIERFLFPDFSHQHDPFLLQGMDDAVARLRLAQERKERVMIHGDYDADGVTAAALMFRVLSAIGIKAYVYIPTREDGYGLQRDGLMQAREHGCTLVVTVDCGITAVSEALAARELGLELIITDHHTPGEVLPQAVAVINPRLCTCPYPFKDLAGVGVAYKVAYALLGAQAHEFLDLVAVGTVADVAPLLGENRLFVHKGLELLRQPSLGFAALMQVAGLNPKDMRAGHIGFGLAPRLNAAGRLADAALPLSMLLTRDAEKAMRMAQELEALNRERQRVELDVLTAALALVNPKDRAIVLCGPAWPHGVVGIVAARLVEKFYRPTILLCQDEQGQWRGSGRSIPGFDLVQALWRCADTLAKCGGHSMAAGLTLADEQLAGFRTAFLGIANALPDSLFTPRIIVDAELKMQEVDADLLTALERLAPFGVGNPEPVFCARHLTVTDKRVVGKAGEHLRLMWSTEEGSTQAGIMFKQAARSAEICVGDKIEIAFRVSREEYRGQVQLSIRLQDFKVEAEWWLVLSPALAQTRFTRLDPLLQSAFFTPAHVFTPLYLRRQGSKLERHTELVAHPRDTCIVVAPALSGASARCSLASDVMYNGNEACRILAPDREALGTYYRWLASRTSFRLTEFAAQFNLPLALAYSVAAGALSIFAELELLEYSFEAGVVQCQTQRTAKRDLAQSATFRALSAWSKQGG